MSSDLQPVVCLMTDFGLIDHYVGSLKGVLLNAVPELQIVDLTHEIPPQNIRAGAYYLMAAYRYHSKGTLFLCVVDPGVGSDRKIIYVEASGWRFIAPDNGLLSWVLDLEKPNLIVDISHPPSLPPPTGRTFHGRDIMAPVAGRILKGEKPESIGPVLTKYEKFSFPSVNKIGALWQAEVIVIDRYGNLITNIRANDVASYSNKSKVWFELENVSETVRGLSEAYASVKPGKLVAVEGSSGFVEIAVRDGHAAKKTGLKEGGRINVYFRT